VTFEQLISQQRPHVGRVLQALARRHHLAPPEIAEFQVVVDLAFERNDYELLKAFDGRSTWETYLTTVVTRLFFSYQGGLWGQWRPTALAQRQLRRNVLEACDRRINPVRGPHHVDRLGDGEPIAQH